jgi:hypothetical protein
VAHMGFSPFGYTLIPTELLLVSVKAWLLNFLGSFSCRAPSNAYQNMCSDGAQLLFWGGRFVIWMKRPPMGASPPLYPAGIGVYPLGISRKLCFTSCKSGGCAALGNWACVLALAHGALVRVKPSRKSPPLRVK